MKQIKQINIILVLLFSTASVVAQLADIQYFRNPDQRGINVYETSKTDTISYKDIKLRLGGAFAIQFQGLNHENADDNLINIGSNFNLPTANLDLDAQLHDGVRMNLRIYLSSRHHEETYVKGGYLQIDKLDFISKDFLKVLMQYTTIKVGMMEINYGDAHFRRSDNAHTLYNPFSESYIMDSFTTEIAGEITFQKDGWLAMVGLTNGRLNQSVSNTTSKAAFEGKLGHDKQINDDVRMRLTGSIYSVSGTKGIYLYGGDRAGSHFYQVMDVDGQNTNDFSGRLNPGFKTDMTSFMINPFLKYKGLEFFGMYESSSGRDDVADSSFSGNRKWNQLGGEFIYRFGMQEKFYVGFRVNEISGQLPGVESDKVKIERMDVGAGWFMTKNILTKIEYVSQQYKDYPTGNSFRDGEFSGVMVEAAIAF